MELLSLFPPAEGHMLFVYAFIGGFWPPILWLAFWLREDKVDPEPARIIIGSFIFGCLAALFAIPFQGLFAAIFPTASLVISIIVFSSIEELTKFFSVYITALKDSANNEPFDPVIYMITAALGFSALENTLYLIDYMNNFDLVTTYIERGKRFIGATLLHTVSSAFIGIALALSFGERKWLQKYLLPIGILGAITLHSYFNIFVTSSESNEVIFAFVMVWIAFVVTLLALELMKAYFKVRAFKRDMAQKERLNMPLVSNPFGKYTPK